MIDKRHTLWYIYNKGFYSEVFVGKQLFDYELGNRHRSQAVPQQAAAE